jgi:hypothetical protein
MKLLALQCVSLKLAQSRRAEGQPRCPLLRVMQTSQALRAYRVVTTDDDNSGQHPRRRRRPGRQRAHARVRRCGKDAIAKVATRIGWHGTRRWGAAVTEALNVPLDRRGTPRTYHLVANTLGVANCQTVAPPALGDTQQGKAAVPEWTAAAQSRAFRCKSAEAAAAAKQGRAAETAASAGSVN